MKIVILGSDSQDAPETMGNFAAFFENKGCNVIFPTSAEIDTEEDVLPESKEMCHDRIRECDMIFLVNPGGWIDKTMSDELQYALSFNKSIYALEKPKGGACSKIAGWLYN